MSDRERLGDWPYIESRWERVIRCDGSYRHYAKGTILFNLAPHVFIESADVKAAADYTEQREQQIREKVEEIDLARCLMGEKWVKIHWTAPAQRILATLEAQLAELQKGWKG